MASRAIDELLWYSRLILWLGAVILLAEAVSGRSAALFSVAGTLCLAGGFAAFLAALAFGGQDERTRARPITPDHPEGNETEPPSADSPRGAQASRKPSSVPGASCGAPGGDHLSRASIT